MTVEPKPAAAALFVDSDANFKVIRHVPAPDPTDGEVLVEVLFSGVNPADIKHATHLGVLSTTLGYDFSGRVAKAGPNSSFKTGDLVAGHTPTGVGRPRRFGTHQAYLACPEATLFAVPDNLPPAHAACLTTVLATAADALCNIFGFPLPGAEPKEGWRQGPLLIWGASASVGLCMLQLARASGAGPIFVTASGRRHDMLRKLGAARCFDYAAPDVAERIRAAVAEAGAGPVAYAADCAGSMGENGSAAQMLQCVGEGTEVLSVVVQPDKRFERMPLASAHAPCTLQIPGGYTVTFPARPEDFGRMWASVLWAAENYGKGFSLPAVEVFKGDAEKALEEVKKVAGQGRFGKLVLEHPLL